ncbi:hypothetical protein FF2_009959 [Malus domestica]
MMCELLKCKLIISSSGKPDSMMCELLKCKLIISSSGKPKSMSGDISDSVATIRKGEVTKSYICLPDS